MQTLYNELINLLTFLIAETTPVPGQVYYLTMRATNIGANATDTTLKYQGPQGPEELDVLAGQIVTKEIMFTTSVQPATVEIKGYDKVTNAPIMINGKETIFVNPTPTKVVTEINISDQSKSRRV